MADEIIKGVAGGIAKTIPQVYEDGLQPAVKEVGKALGTTAKLVHVAISPLRAFLWGWEQVEVFLTTTVAEKLKGVPEERIISPKPTVAVPALQSLQYCHHEEHLRDLYAQLLATSMDAQNSSKAHPSFVEIIRNLSSDEARIIRHIKDLKYYPVIHFNVKLNPAVYGDESILPGTEMEAFRYYSLVCKHAGCDEPKLCRSYLDNLIRLGLIHICNAELMIMHEDYWNYEELEHDPEVVSLLKASSSVHITIQRKYAEITAFGDLFIAACVV